MLVFVCCSWFPGLERPRHVKSKNLLLNKMSTILVEKTQCLAHCVYSWKNIL